MPTVAAPSDVPVLAGERWFVPVTESWGIVQNPSTNNPRVPTRDEIIALYQEAW